MCKGHTLSSKLPVSRAGLTGTPLAKGKGMTHPKPTPFYVRWTNHGYSSSDRFASVIEATEYARTKGFEFSVVRANGNEMQLSWTVFGGYRYYTGEARRAISKQRADAEASYFKAGRLDPTIAKEIEGRG